MKLTKEQIDRINTLETSINKEFKASDYILFNAIKKFFNLKRINFAEYLIMKKSIEKIIKEKRLN